MAISGGDGSIILTTKVDDEGLNKGLSSLKKGVGAFGKAFAIAGAAGVAAFAGITKAAVDSYAEYEQLKGGVETLFKDSAGQLMKYADQAYKTAGLSANEYMSTVTSFSASLLQSLGGDTAKAAEYADQAIIDMSDNANKMGTSMESIQYAYQGFAKQNYTMLDNLKLGYGGTKEEMQRLLDDAEKISGIKYDISSFADVTQAIHVIQTELGITGTTALEASSTIQGSASAMKASWQNLLTGMADPTQNFEQLLQNFISSVGTFAGNLLPVVQTAAQGVLQMVQGLLPQLATMVSEMLPMVVEGAVGIVNGIVQVAPQLMEAVIGLLPQLLTAVTSLITQLATALPEIMQIIVAALPTIIQSIVVALPTMIPALINGIVQAMVILIAALPQIIQPIIDNLPMIITAISGALISNLPILIQGAVQLVTALVGALPQIISALLTAMGGVAIQIGEALFSALSEPVRNAFEAAFDAIKSVWEAATDFFSSVWEGIKSVFSAAGDWFSSIFSAAWEGIQSAWSAVTSFFSGIWSGITAVFSAVGSWFTNIFSTAWQGIQNVWGAVVNFFSGIWNRIVGVFSNVSAYFSNIFSAAVNAVMTVFGNIVSFFTGIWTNIKNVFSNASSEFLSVGSNIVQGIINGVTGAATSLYDSLKNLATNALNAAKNALGIESPSTEFRDEVGKMIPAGVAVGIDKARYLVSRAIDRMFADTRSEVQRKLDSYNEKLLESEERYAKESLAIEERREKQEWESKVEAIEKDFQEQKKKAKKQSEIDEAEKKRQEKLDKLYTDRRLELTKKAEDMYLDSLKETAKKERAILEARQKDIENLKKAIVETYTTLAEEAIDSIDDLAKSQGDLAGKLFDYGDLMHEVERKRYGQIVKVPKLSKLEDQIEVLENYEETLLKLRDKGVSEAFFDMVRGMGIDEGLDYATEILKLTDDKYEEYLANWDRKKAVSDRISKSLYKTDAERLEEEITEKFENVENEMYNVGKNSAEEFGTGFLNQLRFIISEIKIELNRAFGGLYVNGVDTVISGGADVVRVPALARGGIAPRKMVAMIGERGREAVLPLETNTGWMDVLADRISSKMGGGTSTVVLQVGEREFGRAVVEYGDKARKITGTRLVSK